MAGKILVTGGAGYIGSHLVKNLLRLGYDVLVLDNLSCGQPELIPHGILLVGNMGDSKLLDSIFTAYKIEAVCHLGASIGVEQSTQNPTQYYQNNVANTLSLLQAMQRAEVKQIVFASSSAVYGDSPQGGNRGISESFPLHPVSPYGMTKLVVERILEDCRLAYGLQSVILRIFNTAGADPDGELGEAHEPETHLIPNVIQAALGHCPAACIYGHDYATPDGTAIRDYVHVMDVADAFECSLRYLRAGQPGQIFNVGTQQGYSVREIMERVKAISGVTFPIQCRPHRAGDVSASISNSQKAQDLLGWTPRFSELSTLIHHAWNWHSKPMGTDSARILCGV